MKTSPNHPRSHIEGFTLIEVMMSIFVLSAIALTFAITIPMATKSAHLNGQYAQATSLCQHKIDQMRAVGFGRLTYAELSDASIIDDQPTSPPYTFNKPNGVDMEVAPYLPEPTTSINIQDKPGYTGNAKTVTVTITWKPARSQSHTSSMSVTALITN